MRAVAALGVLTTHVAFQTGAVALPVIGPILGRLDLAVALFFALSGFLLWRSWVSHAHDDAPRPSVRRYLRHRVVRIWPAYVVVVIVVVVGIVVWAVSPVRHTDSAQASAPAPEVAPATAVPQGLRVAWTASSDATSVPAMSRSVVVTADNGTDSHGTVVGHDPTTGRELWRYARDLPLCSTAAAWPTSASPTLKRLESALRSL